ncbi:MAG TPA: HAD family hydrolase [bacterium]|nr:HAD family hydrolase [bacterium]
MRVTTPSLEPSHLKLVMFDWDGTLMDSTERIVSSFQNAMRTLSLPVLSPESIMAIIGLGLPEAADALFPELDLAAQKRLAQVYQQYYFELDPTPMRLYDGAEDLLADLAARGFWLSVATGKSRRGLNEVLESTGLGRYFFATRCAEETLSKPDPLMLRELMFEAQAEPAQCLMVGDTQFDLDMARHARVPAVGVTHGAHGHEALAASQPVALVDDLYALAAWMRPFELQPL